MAHLIQQEAPKPKKQFKFKMPSLAGKFGFSLEFFSKQVFIGIAIAEIEVESVVKQKRYKVFKSRTKSGTARFVDTSQI